MRKVLCSYQDPAYAVSPSVMYVGTVTAECGDDDGLERVVHRIAEHFGTSVSRREGQARYHVAGRIYFWLEGGYPKLEKNPSRFCREELCGADAIIAAFVRP